MAYAFSITHGGVTKNFDTPPAGIPPGAVERAIAITFDLSVGSFGIESRRVGITVVGFIHSGLQGDWDLVLFRGAFLRPLLSRFPGL